MPAGQLHRVLQHLRRTALPRGADLGDGELLERFVARRDEAAFAELVRRHGPMVLGVCRRVLRHEADAEDAFQATFLVLVKKARSVVPRALVGNWLYGVAHNTARKAKAMNSKRRARERLAGAAPRPAAPAEACRQLYARLDEELSRLPDKYRAPVVLCDLEGKSYKEAARLLGWPQGTLSGRLTRARVLLARRMARHGLALSGGALAAALAPGAAAGVPAPLAVSTVKAAAWVAAGQAAPAGAVPAQVAALTEGVLKAMLLTKLKAVTAVAALALGATALGGWGLAGDSTPAGPTGFKSAPKTADVRPAPRPADAEGLPVALDFGFPTRPRPKDAENIQGTWVLVSAEREGKKLKERGSVRLVITSDSLNWEEGKVRAGLGYKLDPSKSPKQIDLINLGKTIFRGIYLLAGDTLLTCGSDEGRPTEFSSKGASLFVYQREPQAGGARANEPRAEGTREEVRSYVMESKVFKTKPGGGDEVVIQPQVAFLEGATAQVLVHEQVVPVRERPDKAGPLLTVSAGTSFEVTVRDLGSGRVLLDLSLQRSEFEKSDDNDILVPGHVLRAVREVELGKKVKLVLAKDTKGAAEQWIELTVTRGEWSGPPLSPEPGPTPRPAPPARKAHPAPLDEPLPYSGPRKQ